MRLKCRLYFTNTNGRHLEFLALPAVFQCAEYTGDIIVTERTNEGHLNNLGLIIKQLQDYGLKCHKQ